MLSSLVKAIRLWLLRVREAIAAHGAVIEVWMTAGLLGRNAAGWIVD